jgi:IMP dehydrogenase
MSKPKPNWFQKGLKEEFPYRGALSFSIQQLIGGMKAGMGYLGAINILRLQQKAGFNRIPSSGLKKRAVSMV